MNERANRAANGFAPGIGADMNIIEMDVCMVAADHADAARRIRAEIMRRGRRLPPSPLSYASRSMNT